jgi:hypothetical protein
MLPAVYDQCPKSSYLQDNLLETHTLLALNILR